MSDTMDREVWSGLERRLAAVEALVPTTPPWRPSGDVTRAVVRVRMGPAFHRRATGRASRPRLAFGLALIGLLLAAAVLAAGALLQARPVPPEFDPTGIHARSGLGETAILADGRAFSVVGGWVGMEGLVANLATIWNPVSDSVSRASLMIVPRVAPTATALLDGRVLIAGGFAGPYADGSSATAAAELWDPADGTFLAVGNMAEARAGHVAILLLDGRVLITGDGPTGATAEVFDPRTGTFAGAGSIAGHRLGHAVTLLPDGRVAIAGASGDGNAIGTIDIWDPVTNGFTTAIALPAGLAPVTLTLLADGDVLVLSTRADPLTGLPPLPVAHRWDPRTGKVEGAGTSSHQRIGFTALRLLDGRVAILGGFEDERRRTSSRLVEIWDPASGTFLPASPLPVDLHDRHAAWVQPDGRIRILQLRDLPTGAANVAAFAYEIEEAP